MLLEAARLAPSVRLKIVGDGPEEEALRTRADDLGLTNVEFVGPHWGSDLDGLLAETRSCSLGACRPSGTRLSVRDQPIVRGGQAGHRLRSRRHAELRYPGRTGLSAMTPPIPGAGRGDAISMG